LASAANTIGSSCALVPSASRSLSIASSTFEVPVKASPMPFLQRLDAPALPQEAVPPARAEIGDAQISGSAFSRSTLAHILDLARA
jgi:hypothetical protein